MSKGIVDTGEYKSTMELRRQCGRCLLCTRFNPEDAVRILTLNTFQPLITCPSNGCDMYARFYELGG
jgi:hypothetical protein